jgi:hypothetical protein
VKTTKHRNVHAVQGDAIYPHLAVDEEKSMPEQERCQNTMVMTMKIVMGMEIIMGMEMTIGMEITIGSTIIVKDNFHKRN